MYISIPILVYAGERTLRALRAGNYKVDVVKVQWGFPSIAIPSGWLCCYFVDGLNIHKLYFSCVWKCSSPCLCMQIKLHI
jgi:hypothetical protein